jgi:hypothetical protein
VFYFIYGYLIYGYLIYKANMSKLNPHSFFVRCVCTTSNSMNCAWCNKSEDIFRMQSVPDRWGHYEFCKSGPCSVYYNNYVYRKDLTYGLPHFIKERESSNQCCDFCGKVSVSTVNLPFKDLKHFTFCKNSTCYRRFSTFMQHNRVLDTFVCRIPYIFRSVVITKLKELDSVTFDV